MVAVHMKQVNSTHLIGTYTKAIVVPSRIHSELDQMFRQKSLLYLEPLDAAFYR